MATHDQEPPMDLSITEIGESFNSENTKSQQPFVCEICVEPKAAASEWFGIKNCSHAYCTDCMVSYVASKLEENITSIRCPDPDCTSGLLDPDHCRSILPQEVFERWGVALCEAVVPASQKFYCPYKDCSAMLIIDDDGKKGMIVRQSDCPNCRNLFCVQCKVPWHVGLECAKFQKLKVEREREKMLRNLAKKERWRRCPNCRFYVERSSGCNLIQCRCKTGFCYECGYINCKCKIDCFHCLLGCCGVIVVVFVVLSFFLVIGVIWQATEALI